MTERAKKLLLLYYKQSRKIRRVSGLPPLTFKAKKAGTMKDYRIYGNTAGGESVGDRTANLFDENAPVITTYIRNDGSESVGATGDKFIKKVITVTPNTMYTISWVSAVAGSAGNLPYVRIAQYNAAGDFINRLLFEAKTKAVYSPTSDANAVVWDVRTDSEQSTRGQHFVNFMFNSGSTALPYEPYGYRVPVTVTNGADTQTTNLYLPEQIKMVGDNVEYVDYQEQKQHFADGTSADVSLPTLPTLSGTNTLIVGTEVQPSSVEIKGRIKAAGGD